MAIVKGPALSIEASGNLGAICYSKWRSLQIARDVWTGTVPNTAKQQAQQGLLTAVSKGWGGTLNADERLTWTVLARSIVWTDRLGSPYVPSGYQLFMKWNIRRKVMGLVIMLEAPTEQESVYVEEIRLGVNVAVPHVGMRLAKQAALDVDSYGVEYYKAGPYDSGGRRPIAGEWLYLDREIPPSNYIDLVVTLAKWYWYRGRQISEFGYVGNFFEGQVEII